MFKSIDKWLPGYLGSILRRPRRPDGVRHLIFCLADHFEPVHWEPDPARRGPAVRDWLTRYRNWVSGFRDADGHAPQHTFFYPAEDADPESLTPLAEACRTGFGEVEIHLHHRNDTGAGLTAKLIAFRDLLHREYGLLGTDPEGRIRYGFVHGNWALCNSRLDGDWCGVNAELSILAETGCYADFTFPSAPSPTQPRMVNALYLARDRGQRPRGADEGERAEVGQKRGFRVPGSGFRVSSLCSQPSALGLSSRDSDPCFLSPDSSLLIIQGPLGLNWKRRKWGIVPRIENAALTGINPPTPDRVDLWIRQGIHVRGRPEWIFVKVHAHGFDPGSRALFSGGGLVDLHRDLQRRYNDGVGWRLHYVTAREMANLVRAAQAGKEGDPGPWRDWGVKPPYLRGAAPRK